MNDYDLANALRRQQMLQSLIMQYGFEYLDRLDPEDIEQMIEDMDRYFE